MPSCRLGHAVVSSWPRSRLGSETPPPRLGHADAAAVAVPVGIDAAWKQEWYAGMVVFSQYTK
jgi:hypothetical protein